MTGDEGQVRAKRDAAARARRLSLGVADDVTRNRMLAFAASLDAEADALEASMVTQSPPPVTTQMQMQTQQGPPAMPPKDDGSDDP